ncbi:hypothetical protein ACS0TY_010873 [Phlomoides rotata]
MAEEHEFQSPEGHRLCVNNCGFFSSPVMQNMCSKCYRDLGLHKSGDLLLFSSTLTGSHLWRRRNHPRLQSRQRRRLRRPW